MTANARQGFAARGSSVTRRDRHGLLGAGASGLLRIFAALLFLEHGLMKLFGFPTAQPGAARPLTTQMRAAGWIETICGALLVLGLFTQLAAFIAAGEVAVAYFLGHARKSFWPAINGGGEAILFCFVFLYVAFAGGGPIALDALFR